jgi:hypothetical protein
MVIDFRRKAWFSFWSFHWWNQGWEGGRIQVFRVVKVCGKIVGEKPLESDWVVWESCDGKGNQFWVRKPMFWLSTMSYLFLEDVSVCPNCPQSNQDQDVWQGLLIFWKGNACSEGLWWIAVIMQFFLFIYPVSIEFLKQFRTCCVGPVMWICILLYI